MNYTFQIDEKTKEQYCYLDNWNIKVRRYLTTEEISSVYRAVDKFRDWNKREDCINVLLGNYLLEDCDRKKEILDMNYDVLQRTGFFYDLRSIASESVNDIYRAIQYQDSFARIFPAVIEELSKYAEKFNLLKEKN